MVVGFGLELSINPDMDPWGFTITSERLMLSFTKFLLAKFLQVSNWIIFVECDAA